MLLFFLLYDWFHLSMLILLVICSDLTYAMLLSSLILLGGRETIVKLDVLYIILSRNS